MNTPSPSIRALARRLLAAQTADRSPWDPQGHEVVRVCETLRIFLTRSVGADGFTTLLRRALVLARADLPSLQTVKVSADGRLEGFDKFAANAGDGVEAATTITAHLLGLLVTFIGEPLTLRLMRDAWPEASGRIILESEDF